MNFYNKILLKFLFGFLTFVLVESDDCTIDVTSNIVFQYFSNYNHLYKEVPNDGDVNVFRTFPNFDPKRPTYFYFPGLNLKSSPNDTHAMYLINIVVNGFLELDQTNIIVITSVNVSLSNPMECIISAMGAALSPFFHNYIQLVQNETQMHLLGYDVGAEIMGATAWNYGKGKLRLTAISPSYNTNYLQRENVAYLLDIITAYNDLSNNAVQHYNFSIYFDQCQANCTNTDIKVECAESCDYITTFVFYSFSTVWLIEFPKAECTYSGGFQNDLFMAYQLDANSFISGCNIKTVNN